MDSSSSLAAIFTPEVMSLIKIKARRFGRIGHLDPDEIEDLEQDFALALGRAAPRFNTERGDLAAWASTVMENCWGMMIRARRCLKRGEGKKPVSLDLAVDPSSASTLGDVLKPSDAMRRLGLIENDADLQQDVRNVVATLTTELQVVVEALTANKTIKAAARDLGISRTKLYRLIEILLRCFRDAGLGDF